MNRYRRKVLYIREQRFLNRDMLDLLYVEFEFSDLTSYAFLFNLNVVVCQFVNLFDRRFDKIVVENFEYRIIGFL